MTKINIIRPVASTPILSSSGPNAISIVAGTKIEIDGRTLDFFTDTAIKTGELQLGSDYGISFNADGAPVLIEALAGNPVAAGLIAGFHVAPLTRDGDHGPAINPSSIWDLDFRPSCDPRGMTLIEVSGAKVWVDIYLLGTEHMQDGTSRYGVTIADGIDLPVKLSGEGRCKKLDYATAAEIYAHHGKRLLGAEEFFAAAYGVTERCARGDEPEKTGETSNEAHRFISKVGLIDATGTMWQWGTDGHTDDPRPAIFGGSWLFGSFAGSRCADLDCWPEFSSESISARGACDHLMPA